MPARVLSFTLRERRELCNSVERKWHKRLLELARLNSELELLPHCQKRMVQRGITQREVNLLLDEGCIWAIEVGSDRASLHGWAPKWILCWPSIDNWVIGGVFAYDGEKLLGITVYHERSVAASLSTVRSAA